MGVHYTLNTVNMFSKICLFALLALVAARRPPRFPQDFKWSSAGPVRGWRCVRIHEGADRQGTWHDNYFCQHPHTADIGMAWRLPTPTPGGITTCAVLKYVHVFYM